MSVYKPKNSPNYHFDFMVAGERYCGSTGCTSKSAAKEHERKKRNEIAEGIKPQPDLTLDEACGLYWQQRGKYEASAGTTEGQIKRLVAHFGGSTIIRDLDRAEIDRFVAKRRGQKARGTRRLVSNATVNREVQLLKRVLNRVPDTYARPSIDWRGVMLREPKERQRELTADEERELFAKLPGDLANVVEFAMLSGQRREAIITLLWSKVDLINERAEVFTKGGEWHKFPLSPRMVALIRSQPRVASRVFTYVCERNSPPRKNRARRIAGERYPFSSEGWYRKWKKALKDAGVEDFRFHDLRHTAATRMTRSTGNLKVVQKLLNHSNIATTARYAHAVEDDVRQALIQTESRNTPEQPSDGYAENGGNLRGRA